MPKIALEEWQIKTIGNLVVLQYGRSPKDVLSADGKYPVIGTGGITGYATSYLHDGNTTVIGRKGTINKPSYIEGKFWAIDTTYFTTDYKTADPKWFFYILNSFDLSKYNEASGVPSLGRDTLYTIPLLTPPIPEQQKIATILSSVDDVIEKTRAQIDKLNDLKTGMMQELLTKGIGHTEFKDSPVGRIPTEWDVIALGEIGKWKGGGTPSKANKEYWTGSIPWVSPKDMKSEFINSTEDQISEKAAAESSTNMISAGSILVVIRSGILKHTLPVAIAGCDLAVNQDMKGLTVKKGVSKLYIYHYLLAHNHHVLRSTLKAGNTVESLDFDEFRKLLVPYPSLEEQQKIANVVEAIARKARIQTARLSAYNNTKKALMQDLLTGKVRVSNDSQEVAVA